MRELALFAGAGGGILGGLLLGWRTVCAVELDPYCRSVLLARQRDGLLARFPIWDDVRTFDGKPWNGKIDVISGGFPCQDISSAGPRTGLDGERSGLWREFARIVEEVEPAHVFIENSPHLRTRGLVVVLQDLARMGFHARWGVFGADNVRAPHPRKRMWIVADSDRSGQRDVAEHEQVAGASAPDGVLFAATVTGQQQFSFQSSDANGEALREQPRRSGGSNGEEEAIARVADWWPVDLIQGVDDGVANRMDRVAATGNGQVPRVARLAWETLR
jgi:DNA (cytosine-5)-methyltransferase 1